MKKGDILFGRWGWSYSNWKFVYFRYRITPVPGTGKCRRYCWHRPIRTQQEIRENAAYPEFVRGKRKVDLALAFEPHRSDERCWKRQRKVRKQWMKNKMWDVSSVG